MAQIDADTKNNIGYVTEVIYILRQGEEIPNFDDHNPEHVFECDI